MSKRTREPLCASQAFRGSYPQNAGSFNYVKNITSNAEIQGVEDASFSTVEMVKNNGVASCVNGNLAAPFDHLPLPTRCLHSETRIRILGSLWANGFPRQKIILDCLWPNQTGKTEQWAARRFAKRSNGLEILRAMIQAPPHRLGEGHAC